MKKCLFVAVIATILLCSCTKKTTIVHEDIPVTVSKLANSSNFDTLSVIKDDEYIYIYENKEYKESVSLTYEHPMQFLIAGILVGLLLAAVLASLFSD